jgi:uncharacterized cupredoxin-like copper-binding protein
MAASTENPKMKTIHFLIPALIALASATAAAHEAQAHGGKPAPVRKEQKPWGIAGDPHAATRTIEIVMADTMRFSPDLVRVKQGETVRFTIRNAGQVLHEMVIGTREELDQHAALMVKFPGMEHDEPYMAHVAKGRQQDLVWTFNRAGEFDFACLIAGHYQAGMVGKIRVAAAHGKGD